MAGYSAFRAHRKQGSERLSDRPQVKPLVSGQAGTLCPLLPKLRAARPSSFPAYHIQSLSSPLLASGVPPTAPFPVLLPPFGLRSISVTSDAFHRQCQANFPQVHFNHCLACLKYKATFTLGRADFTCMKQEVRFRVSVCRFWCETG